MKNPAIDKLVDRIILAKDRDELVAATQALGPRAAVEPLSRSTVAHAVRPPGAVGHVWASGQAAVALDLVPARVVV
jgi:hypothetical protein